MANTRFQIHEISPLDPSFPDLIAVEIQSFENPFQSIFRFFYPVFGSESDKEKKIAHHNLVELQRKWALEDPDSVWMKVVDTEDEDRIVGGLLIKIHTANPFDKSKQKDESAVWYPPGSQRDYIDACLSLFNAPREKFMARSHLYSYIGFVHPDYRRHGIADLLLAEEIRRADELGLEAYMEAVTAMGVPIFMRHQFIPWRKVVVRPENENPDTQWKDMESKMQPLRFWPMWRPKYGKLDGARPPWEGERGGMFSKL